MEPEPYDNFGLDVDEAITIWGVAPDFISRNDIFNVLHAQKCEILRGVLAWLESYKDENRPLHELRWDFTEDFKGYLNTKH